MMESLMLQDFRCFAGSQEVPLLVGENSSGKTSFLAAARIAEQLRFPADRPDFNQEPFLLGAYDELVNYRGGKAGRATAFVLGSRDTTRTVGDPKPFAVTNSAEFVKLHAQPFLKTYKLASDAYAIEIELEGEEEWGRMIVRTPAKPNGVLVRQGVPIGDNAWSIITTTFQFRPESFSDLGNTLDSTEQSGLARLVKQSATNVPPYAAAPIRAQPKRTYELLNDTPRPQGEHVPILLAQIYGRKEWDDLRGPLESFARAAGLFDEITVRRLGKGESSPFQIVVKFGGPARKLIDVGYGVSQVLPLLVDLLRDKRQRMYLIQQPEVHLHPRAQAELSSLFGTIAKTHFKQLLIETHSDHIIDRFRMEVRDKKLKPSDVMILYFERHKTGVTIHPLKLDERGNLLNVPPTYRQFFLDEERRFLGVG
jgi:hypothetical protein